RDEALCFEAERVELSSPGGRFHLSAQGPLAVRVEKGYMKLKRGLGYFRPLDKKAFARAPAGWCSWYVFWQGIREEQVVENTAWLAANLKKFGCEYVQIDDGWQGVGQGNGENRDWYVTEKHKFPHGMKWLAGYIRGKGFRPGLWLIPFATSDSKLFAQQPNLFIRRNDGTTVYEATDPKTGKTEIDWTGRYVVDPTGPEGRRWFTDLFRMITIDWGYDYVKIDGQGGSAGACSQYRQRLADPKLLPDDAYRAGLQAIKAVMGKDRFLLNCGGQYSSAGLCEGIRIGGDVGPDWAGMQPAIQATMQSLYMNNLCFWTDPDVVCVRPPLSLDQARLWATLLGITGQLLMTSDDMPKLGPERVELVKRIFPVADIRPMDLYPLAGKPRIFDLRVASAGAGQWDVVAVFNWDALQSVSVRLEPKDLGWPAGRFLYYDVWQKKLLGTGPGGLTVALAPGSCKVLAVRPAADHPQLAGTSRHLTQGADDLIEAAWDPAHATWKGQSRVVGGDDYELRFTLPPGWTSTDARAKIDGPLAVLTLKSDENRTMAWSLAFEKTSATAAAAAVGRAKATAEGPSVVVAWKGEGAVAYRVYRNGELVDETADCRFVDHLRHQGTYRYEVSAVGWQGESARVAAGQVVRRPLPKGQAPDAWLDTLTPVSQQQDCGVLQRSLSVDGKPLRIGGKTYARGLGTHANSQVHYALDNRYRRFEADAGVDDEKDGGGTVVFQVLADGRKVFDSGVMRGKQPAKKVLIDLDGVEELLLIVTDAGDGINSDHADWANARLIGNP
ncbi:MAG: NPCBM/NEW2 domain-containing protein, partial [Thermoguttaceae bacterium]